MSVFTLASFIRPHRHDLCSFLQCVIHQPEVYWLLKTPWWRHPHLRSKDWLWMKSTHVCRETKVNQNLYEIYFLFIFHPHPHLSLSCPLGFSLPFSQQPALWGYNVPFSRGCLPCHLIFSSFLSSWKWVTLGVQRDFQLCVYKTWDVYTHSVLPWLASVTEMFFHNSVLLKNFYS